MDAVNNYPIPGMLVAKHTERKMESPADMDIEVNDVEMGDNLFKVTNIRPKGGHKPKEVATVSEVRPPPVFKEAKPKIPVTISGSFGKLKVPFSDVCESEEALVLIQDAESLDYELPTLAEDAELEIMVRGGTYRCLPGVVFVRTSTGEKHTVMLVTEKVGND